MHKPCRRTGLADKILIIQDWQTRLIILNYRPALYAAENLQKQMTQITTQNTHTQLETMNRQDSIKLYRNS